MLKPLRVVRRVPSLGLGVGMMSPITCTGERTDEYPSGDAMGDIIQTPKLRRTTQGG